MFSSVWCPNPLIHKETLNRKFTLTGITVHHRNLNPIWHCFIPAFYVKVTPQMFSWISSLSLSLFLRGWGVKDLYYIFDHVCFTHISPNQCDFMLPKLPTFILWCIFTLNCHNFQFNWQELIETNHYTVDKL